MTVIRDHGGNEQSNMSLPRTPQSSQHTPRTRLRVRETRNRNNNLSGSTAGVRDEATSGDRTPILPEERNSAGPVDFQRAVEGIQPALNGAKIIYPYRS